MERKLATVLFADLVGSTALVSGSDPEVVRRRIARYFDHVSHCVATHGGIVEKFAGDAVMAAFGIPKAHEDDAERAARAAFGILEAVKELGLEVRIGIESGEVVVDEGDSTFATGEAINIAARLQQAAEPNKILIGPGTQRLALGRLELEDMGPLEVAGRAAPVWAWAVTAVAGGGRRGALAEAPLVGREAELELLENTFARALRDRRPHLVTIFGEPGIGKSRLAEEFLESVEASVLLGRALPYGEGITYWPLAEMVKVAAGIADDDPLDTALEKLRDCCPAEAVADLLGLASGVLEAVHGESSQQEIAWAARAWAERMAEPQPLVLVFEDVHWAEEPLLDLIEHLAAWVKDAPVLILTLARPELLDVRPDWGGGRLRATSIELEPLARTESELLVQTLLERSGDGELDAAEQEALFEKTEGNPLFVEETIRMLVEEGREGAAGRIPDTLQALIAARIDRLPPDAKRVLQRASVAGRVFWPGAVAHLSEDLDEVDSALGNLTQRDFVVRELRSTISDEEAYRFKHVLIREVAYGGLAKSRRAVYHERFAEWLRERAGEELLEIRAYHLDHAVTLLAELDGEPPELLAREAAATLAKAGKRALAQEANRAARRMLLRSVELDPTLDRRYAAARAAWRLSDIPAVSVEMEAVREAARDAGDRHLEARAATALAEVALYRHGDVDEGRALAARALELLGDEDDEARFDALDLLSTVGWWTGELAAVERWSRKSLELAERMDRKDLQSQVLSWLVSVHSARLEEEPIEPLLARAAALADESGSIMAQAWTRRVQGDLALRHKDLDGAEAAFEEARSRFAEAGAAAPLAHALRDLALVARKRGDYRRAEKLLREAIRTLRQIDYRGALVEDLRALAELLVEQDRLEEAERFALEARDVVTPQDISSLASTSTALALVREAQGRDTEAERLYREALDILAGTEWRALEQKPLKAFVRFLCEHGREEEAQPYEERLDELGAVGAGAA